MTHNINEQRPAEELTKVTKCHSCGGNAEFNPANGMLTCPFCNSETAIEPTHQHHVELDFEQAVERSHQWNEEKRVFSCDNCGAETVLDRHVVADFCSFCGSSHISITEHDAGIQPGLMIPFQITREEAQEKFKVWINKRFFAPGALKKSYRLNKISGAYLPYWTFDSDTSSDYVVQVGTYYYVTETRTVYEDGQPKQVTEQVRKIRWHTESGRYKKFFDDVLIKASSTVEPGLMSKVEPFQLSGLLDYKIQYMSGFFAERYSISLQQGWHAAQDRMSRSIESGIQSSVHGDIVNVLNVSTDYSKITYKHILLPLWISSFQYDNKVYQFLVNGQTGKVAGKYPLSAMKVALFVASLLAIALIVYFFVES